MSPLSPEAEPGAERLPKTVSADESPLPANCSLSAIRLVCVCMCLLQPSSVFSSLPPSLLPSAPLSSLFTFSLCLFTYLPCLLSTLSLKALSLLLFCPLLYFSHLLPFLLSPPLCSLFSSSLSFHSVFLPISPVSPALFHSKPFLSVVLPLSSPLPHVFFSSLSRIPLSPYLCPLFPQYS